MRINKIKCDQCSDEQVCQTNPAEAEQISVRLRFGKIFKMYDFCCEDCLRDFLATRTKPQS